MFEMLLRLSDFFRVLRVISGSKNLTTKYTNHTKKTRTRRGNDTHSETSFLRGYSGCNHERHEITLLAGEFGCTPKEHTKGKRKIEIDAI